MAGTVVDAVVTSTDWRVEVRDAALDVIGVCDVYDVLDVTLRQRKAGAWAMSMPAAHPQASLFTEGSGIIVWAPWDAEKPVFTGPVLNISPSLPTKDSAATLDVSGIDDTALLADRIVLPDPSSSMSDQDAVAAWSYSGKAEGAIRTVVNVNAGAGAIVSRRMCNADPFSRLGNPPILLGSTMTVASRFDNLLMFIGEIAAIDNLHVRLYQPRAVKALHLEVSAPADLSDHVRLSQHTGTLVTANGTLGAPGATHVLVAGGGEGTARVLVERSDTSMQAVWGRRVEAFRDARDTSDLIELAKRGDETLAEAIATAAVSLTPVDTMYQRYGYDYGLGDTITVEVGNQQYTDIVTSVKITLTAAGGVFTVPSVGDPDATNLTTPVIYARVRDLTRRLDALERRQ